MKTQAHRNGCSTTECLGVTWQWRNQAPFTPVFPSTLRDLHRIMCSASPCSLTSKAACWGHDTGQCQSVCKVCKVFMCKVFNLLPSMERRGSRREGGRKGGMERGGVRVISLVYILRVRRLQPQGRCDKRKRKLVSASNKWLFWSSNPALKSGSFNKEGCYLISLETLSSRFPLNIPQWIFRCQCREVNLKAMLSSRGSESLET